ncbi:MAG: LLM class flavin-dependent oxidoreductase [Frankia sp.]
MKIGIGLPATVPGVTGSGLLDWARRAEERDFSSLAVLDRLVYPNYEPLVTLAAAAAVTERIRLATTILVGPYRNNAALLAKQAATIDHLSGGRLVLGLAAGGREDDYRASGVDYATRGARLDADLDVLERAWAGQPVADAGPVGPRPPRGRPTVILGGTAPAAFHRAARHGDGWIFGGGNPKMFADGRADLEAAWRAAGRQDTPHTMSLPTSRWATPHAGRRTPTCSTTTAGSATSPAPSRPARRRPPKPSAATSRRSPPPAATNWFSSRATPTSAKSTGWPIS